MLLYEVYAGARAFPVCSETFFTTYVILTSLGSLGR